MSTASHTNTEPLTSGTELQSDSGQTYQIEEVLADRRKPLLCVYRASAERRNYIVKNMIKGDFDYQLSLQKSLSALPNVRKVIDTVKDLGMLIYPLLSGDLFHLSQKNLSEKTRRYILQKALQGLADMHDKDVLHNDIKPNNILVDYEERPEDGIAIKTVQISDLENAVIVPPGKWLAGSLCGNAIWRSPESWCRSRQNQASDVFSFGIVMIYVMANEMVFRVNNSQLTSEWRHILTRHISYFGDEDDLEGFLEHIGEQNPFYELLIGLASSFGSDNPRQPFQHWAYVEPDLRDLVSNMTKLDPRKRITAREALQHRWFSQTQ